MSALLAVEGLAKQFEQRPSLVARALGATATRVRAVDGVSLAIARGETLGLIGESGCGKSTLGRCILRLHEPSAGTIRFDGVDIRALDAAALRAMRRRMQIIFQDPYASLNPRRTVAEIVGLPLRIHAAPEAELQARVRAMVERVGLLASQLERYPHQFSGGQRQRIGIARALILRPELVVCDEPVSALDVSIQAQIIELLRELRREFALTYLFISHDLAVVGHLSDRIAVMYLGEIVETGPTRSLIAAPKHPYTQALLAAAPRLKADGQRARLAGDPPSPLAPPPGCKFHTRCPVAMPQCRSVHPAPIAIAPGHTVACHLYGSA
jgi:peptide/nickel transport system ATP-binding protein/oligopeptide transport system ATP-binding protein